MHQKIINLTMLIVLSLTTECSFGHGGPVNVFVNPNTQRMYVVQSFEPVNLILEPGQEISSRDPGFGVSFASNGLAAGTEIGLEVTQKLLYWNGNELAATSAIITVENPEFDSAGTPVETDVIAYDITETTGLQTGMTWGVYPGGSNWDAHGIYFLNPLAADPGVYGVVVRITSPDYNDSAPFLFPLVHNLGNITAAQVEDGIDLMRSLVQDPLPGDFDGNQVVDGLDFEAWKGLHGVTTDLSADGNRDGVTNAADYTVWLANVGASQASGTSTQFIPEPNAGILALFGFYIFSFYQRQRR